MIETNSAAPIQKEAVSEGRVGFGKVGSGIIACWLSTYFTNQLSLHGIDFTTMGISSEVVKSTLEGFIVGVLVFMTPTHFVASITDIIIFVKTTLKQWRDAWNGTNQ